MSKKRFYRASVCGDDGLYDKEDGCIIVNVRSNIDLDDNWNTVVDKLNEQQTTIQSLKSDKAIAEDYANIFEKENVKLRKQIGEQQATISALKEENEQLKQSNDRFADTVAKQVSLLIELRKENEQLRKQVAEYEMILRQHEFAEKEGFK